MGGGSMFASGMHPEMGKWVSAVRVLKTEAAGCDGHWGSVSMMSTKAQELHKMHDIVDRSMAIRRERMPATDDCAGCMMQEFPDDANVAILQVCSAALPLASLAYPYPCLQAHVLTGTMSLARVNFARVNFCSTSVYDAARAALAAASTVCCGHGRARTWQCLCLDHYFSDLNLLLDQ